MEIRQTKVEWKKIGIPEREMKRLSSNIKEELQGVIVKNNRMYITDSFYVFSKPFENKDTVIDINGNDKKDIDGALNLVDSIDKMFIEAKKRKNIEISMNVELLERMINIAKLNNTDKFNRIKISVTDTNETKPVLIIQGDAEYLVMPCIK